jgi:hypothetical protein
MHHQLAHEPQTLTKTAKVQNKIIFTNYWAFCLVLYAVVPFANIVIKTI